MERRHDMPFGAECRDDGSVRFRLWAPAAHNVDLRVMNSGAVKPVPLAKDVHGWFEWLLMPSGLARSTSSESTMAAKVPDPASRFQPRDVHGPSEVVDPAAFDWQDREWCGRRWEEAVIYELHVGAFTPAGTFSAVRERLDYLADLGITALELMPVADFPGRRNWGYDGVFPFAPDGAYGRPEDLKHLVQATHDRGMMVLLDVVYNHFGPEGNYLRSYAPQFFTDRHRTPWGEAINFDGPESRVVRDFFIHNALYWLIEYHFDGLRLDAVHAISDESNPDILTEIAETVRHVIGPDRHVHLILENDRNQTRYLQRTEQCQPRTYTAQWNEDSHHALHVLISGEKDGYYADYSERPLAQFGRCLTDGFAYQGETSRYRAGEARGESCLGLPPTAFVCFLQNHDQIGNRAFGERITQIADQRAVRAAVAIVLLSPSPPLLFMGEEFGAETPFLFFCDFEEGLAKAVTEGRRSEFAGFRRFSTPSERERIPDPNAVTTFEASRLNWDETSQARHREWLHFYGRLLKVRRQHIVPRLSGACAIKADYDVHPDHGLTARWQFPDGSKLVLLANLGADFLSHLAPPAAQILYASEEVSTEAMKRGTLPPWSVVWFIES